MLPDRHGLTLPGPPREFHFNVQSSLPPLAWIATISDPVVSVRCGTSVRRQPDGFFEGTWSGPPGLPALTDATTVFGTGIVAGASGLTIITPSHQLEGVYHVRVGDRLLVSNSLVGVLTGAYLELDPAVDYPTIFRVAPRAVWMSEDSSGRFVHTGVSIPTTSRPVAFQLVDNLVIGPDMSLASVRKRSEPPFRDFADYERRLTAALASALANARGYEPIVSISAGYDSTAVAAVAARVGCRRALGFATARTSPYDGGNDDSGARTAELLGLAYTAFDRLAYLRSADLPEAEFLASGMTGEELIFSGAEEVLRRSVLLTGYWAGTQWAMTGRGDWRRWEPVTTSGASMTEFRLRAEMIHLPLPVFGADQPPKLLEQPDLRPYRVGGHYDRPIPRRLAEQAGVPRGSFGVAKRAATVLLQMDGRDAFSETSWSSLREFAAAEGRPLLFRRRRRLWRWERGVLAAANRLRLDRLVAPLARRRDSLVHFEPEFGNLALRWAIAQVRPRYTAREADRLSDG